MAKEPNQSSSNKRPFENVPDTENSKSLDKPIATNQEKEPGKDRVRKTSERKKRAWEENAPTAQRRYAGLEGAERERVRASFAERGITTPIRPDDFHYCAEIFLTNGICGDANMDSKITFELIWHNFIEFVLKRFGESQADLMIGFKEQFHWMLMGFLSPAIGYRITNMVKYENSRCPVLVDDRLQLGVPEAPGVKIVYKPNSAGKKLLRKWAWEQFRETILSIARQRKEGVNTPLKPEWVNMEVVNELSPEGQDKASGEKAYDRDLKELELLAVDGKQLAAKKLYHPYIEQLLLLYGRRTTVSHDVDKELQKNIVRKINVISAWQFAGIRLNTEALDEYVRVELDKAAALKREIIEGPKREGIAAPLKLAENKPSHNSAMDLR